MALDQYHALIPCCKIVDSPVEKAIVERNKALKSLRGIERKTSGWKPTSSWYTSLFIVLGQSNLTNHYRV